MKRFEPKPEPKKAKAKKGRGGKKKISKPEPETLEEGGQERKKDGLFDLRARLVANQLQTVFFDVPTVLDKSISLVKK